MLQKCLWDDNCTNKYHKVVYNCKTETITWTYLLFEFRGILFCHCLVVLAQEEVKIVHSRYIILRWSKLIWRRYISIRVAYNTKSDDSQMLTKRYAKNSLTLWMSHVRLNQRLKCYLISWSPCAPPLGSVVRLCKTKVTAQPPLEQLTQLCGASLLWRERVGHIY